MYSLLRVILPREMWPTRPSPKPVFATFEAENPDPEHGVLATGFDGRYQSHDLDPLAAKTIAISKLGPNATFADYEEQLFKPAQAVALIGHSYPGPNGQAIGLCFWRSCIIPYEPIYAGYDGISFEFPANSGIYYDVTLAPTTLKLLTQARVVFISACDIGTDLQDFFGITPESQHNALVVPDGVVQVGINQGDFAWLHVAQHLAQGKTILQAVQLANADIDAKAPWKDPLGNVVPPVHWKVIGNGTLHF